MENFYNSDYIDEENSNEDIKGIRKTDEEISIMIDFSKR